MSDKCKCEFRVRMLGDGCRHCQPQEYIDRAHEWLDEERKENEELQQRIARQGSSGEGRCRLYRHTRCGVSCVCSRDKRRNEMNCPKCGLLIGHGTMGTILPICQCGWQQGTPLNSLDKMEDYDRLAAELAATKQKLAEAEALSVTKILKCVDINVDLYFRSVEEVVDKLSALYLEVEDYELGIKVAPCIQQKLEALEAERKELEKQEAAVFGAKYDDCKYPTEYSRFPNMQSHINAGASIIGYYTRPAPDLQKRIDELEAEVTRLSGASGFCIECERLSRENAQLKQKLAELTLLNSLTLDERGELLVSAARAEGIEEGKKMCGNYSVVGWLRGHKFIPLPELAVKSDEPVYVKRLVAPTHKEE